MSAPDDLDALVARIPLGWSRLTVGGHPYGVSRVAHAGGGSESIEVDPLAGGAGFGANVWRVGGATVLRPCEVPEELVLGFLRSLPAGPGAAPDAGGSLGA